MERVYFESRTPQSKICAAGGELVAWETYDGQVGWFSTEQPGTVKTLENCIERKVGGLIRKGTAAEYEAFVGKAKGRPVFRRDRETISPGEAARQTLSPPVPPPPGPAPAVAADGDGAPQAQPVVATPPSPVLKPRGRKHDAPTGT